MNNLIKNNLQVIEDANKWINATESMQGQKGAIAYRNLVNYRRELNKKKLALEDNPAAAIYGESQVGKSYLVSSLLSPKGKAFNIIDGQNKAYDFIRSVNPTGKGMESTSLVTRFSTSYRWENPDFPIKAKLLTPADLILVLCDTYYNDVKIKIDKALKIDQINNEVASCVEELKNDSTSIQSLLIEDDIYDIQDYFKFNFSTKATNVIHSEFFEKIPLLIKYINYDKWAAVFSILWNKNERLTKLFQELLDHYKLLDFQKEVYLPMRAVLRDYGTLLDVARMYEIYGEHQGVEADYERNTSVLIIENGKEEIIKSYPKPYLCALTAELLFSISSDLEDEKPFLKNTDLLDFPGSRHRWDILEEKIEDEIIPQMLLRGKVSYLFNKYSYLEKINILLYCHHDENSEVAQTQAVLNNWINEMIGETVEDRERFINMSIVPPLFIVSTMFNKDLSFDLNTDSSRNVNSLNARWNKRFERILEKEIIGVETFPWFKDWTVSTPYFQNIFLLRDYTYSSELNSRLYEGYNKNYKEIKEIIPEQYPEFRSDLKKSFIEFAFVKNHFKDPKYSWNEAVDMNKDGSVLIIKNLKTASENINEARNTKIKREITEIGNGILTELKKYYHDADSDNRIQLAKSKAGMLQSSLDISFGKNPYFFGLMMEDLMIKESDIYTLYINEIKDAGQKDAINLDTYGPIRRKVKSLNANDSFEINLQRLCDAYEYLDIEECRDDFEAKGVDLQELFFGARQRVMRFSSVLAESLEKFFFEKHLKENNDRLLETFSNEELMELVQMLQVLYKKLKINEEISERIRKYVDDNYNVDTVYGMIADLSAEVINKFINTVGIEYYTQVDYEDLKVANDKNELGLVLDHSELDFNEITPEGAATLFETLGNLPDLINNDTLPKEVKRLPNFRNYLKWRDRIKTGFVSVCDIPNYDIQANTKLGKIIKSAKQE